MSGNFHSSDYRQVCNEFDRWLDREQEQKEPEYDEDTGFRPMVEGCGTEDE